MDFSSLSADGIKRIIEDYNYGYTTLKEAVAPLKLVLSEKMLDMLLLLGAESLLKDED